MAKMAKQLNWSSCPRWVAGFEAAEAKAALDAAPVSQIVKTASSRGRLGGPCLDTVILALRRRALAGRIHDADRPTASRDKRKSVTSTSHYGLLHRTSGRQGLMLSRWWAADARVERMGARPNRAVVVKTALTCGASPTVVRFWNLVESGSTSL